MRAKMERRGFRSSYRNDPSTKRAHNDRNYGRYMYDDTDVHRHRYSISSELAEDGDQTASTCSDSFDDRFDCGNCGLILCRRDGDASSDHGSELRELRKDTKEVKRMIKPSTVSIVDSSAPSEIHSKAMEIDLVRRYHRNNGKLMVLSQHDLVQVDTIDEQEKRRREEYLTKLGMQRISQREGVEDGIWPNFLQCFPTCISWNNFQKGGEDNSDNVSDITTPKDLMLLNDYYPHEGIVKTPPRHLGVDNLVAQVESSGHAHKLRTRSSNAGVSRERSRRTYSSRTPSSGTPSSNSRSDQSPRKGFSASKSPLRSSRRGKVKARMLIEDGSLLYEV
ncbi:hypothetical protein ACHAW6_006465 [Cyclotella cf. meneghiniana]